MQRKETEFHECQPSQSYSRKVSVFQVLPQSIRRLKAGDEETVEMEHTWEVINSLTERPLKPQCAAASSIFLPCSL